MSPSNDQYEISFRFNLHALYLFIYPAMASTPLPLSRPRPSEPSSLFKIMKLGLITKDSPCLLQDAGRRRRRGSTTRGRKTTACSTRDRTRRTPLMTAAVSGSFTAAARTLAITARRRVRRTRRTDMRRRRRRTRTMRTRSASSSRRICPLSVSPRMSRRMRRDSFDPTVSRKQDMIRNVLSFFFPLLNCTVWVAKLVAVLGFCQLHVCLAFTKENMICLLRQLPGFDSRHLSKFNKWATLQLSGQHTHTCQKIYLKKSNLGKKMNRYIVTMLIIGCGVTTGLALVFN
jgi:hypothetical protein